MKVAGVFDSGIGGLTVLKSLYDNKLFEKIIYYGDTARVPYGSKDKNTIIRYALEAVEFFKNFDIDILIVACNTVSAYALKEMQEVAPFKVVGVIEAGVKAVENSVETDNEILVIGTKATVNSNLYTKLLLEKQFKNINAIPTPLFVSIVEEDLDESEILDVAIKHYFDGIKHPDCIILGCTHFPLISKQLAAYFQNTKLIHSGEAIVESLIEYDIKSRYNDTKLEFFASENPDRVKAIAHKWIGNV